MTCSLAAFVLLSAGCGSLNGNEALVAAEESSPAPTTLVQATERNTTSSIPATTTTQVIETTTTLAETTTTTTSTTTTTTTTAPARLVVDTQFVPFATVGDVVLHLPAARIELIGFHESGHDGSQDIVPDADLLDRGPEWVVMETRDRGTGERTAADIAADPEGEIRSPVTGTVLRAGGYTLYCDHQDDFVVIEPDARPGWEVKMFHIDGVQVVSGDRVEAGVTVIAPKPTKLPFESQIDELTAAPAWTHVHIEVVDPSIPDRPSGGSC